MKRILLIEDDPADCLLYRRYLTQQAGGERLEFAEASSGEAGLALFARWQPDCVLLDYQLPDTDGLRMLGSLQALCPPDTLCVVMVTGRGSETLAVRALHNGALDYLVKQQFDHAMLYKTVAHAIEKNEWRQYVGRYHEQLCTVNQQLRESLLDLTASRQEVHEKNTSLYVANQEIGARNQQLAHTNQDLDNFVYAASHDLKQPVNNLVGLFAELRRTATFHDADEAMVLRLVDESLRNLSTTIHDLAAVVQEQRHPGEQAVEPVSFADLTTEVTLTLRPELLATRAELTVDFAAVPTVSYVRSRLRTVLTNLLSNALKYHQPGRSLRVKVRTYEVAGCPVLEVADNGLGIDLDRFGDELFHLFRRFHPEAGEGTGVGLFLVNRLVEGGGGHLEVDSQPGCGTTFRVYLCDDPGSYSHYSAA
ncbi:response regulator [Hymenobacter sp. HMF4947]|uniref:histidine kinase n=1 Tax=Hymenobacter ginkgonis TaxID=2682976 RepID=A0A7K1T9A4_9BACT|nr:hybrid sensor histidine kinase/response regulator [Hymenobacter ginkgonis]MVN74989.1 response regulator [Hymenobacter ginkgonis]